MANHLHNPRNPVLPRSIIASMQKVPTEHTMPRSIPSYFNFVPPESHEQQHHHDPSIATRTAPPSPLAYRRDHGFSPQPHTGYQSLGDHLECGETTSLLVGTNQGNSPGARGRSYASTAGPDGHYRHNLAAGSLRRSHHPSRANSQARRFASRRPSTDIEQAESVAPSIKDGLSASFLDQRAWYDQFTSTDWVHDSIADGARLRQLRRRKDIRGRLLARVDSAQGWILVAVIGCITAAIAYFVDVSDGFLFDLKEGFCTTRWFHSRGSCCRGSIDCSEWYTWSRIFSPSKQNNEWMNFSMFVCWVVILSAISCSLTLLTKTVVPSTISLAPLDENLGADSSRGRRSDMGNETPESNISPRALPPAPPSRPAKVYYPAAGSGVAEVKVINSGFVLHGYLGLQTLVVKTIALIFSVSSGLSLGKEGPYVHIGTCVGNICCRMFSKYNLNDGKRREVLSASAASGVAVAFGAPIGGVLFSLEEVSYYFPPKTLFRTFFCCIAAALSLKFLNPYGTGKIVLFEVRYLSDWQIFEMILFILLGILGGAAGALFIKASSLWAKSFRRIPAIKRWPMLEVVLVALLTGAVSFWNRYTKLPVSELLFELAKPCEDPDSEIATGLCPHAEGIPDIIRYLSVAFIIKSLLTIVTFGIKVPAGIYVPSMVVGGLMGRIVGHMIQYLAVKNPDFWLFASCPAYTSMESCVTPGVYALVAAGATMCGVTRLSVTLPVILFELTGSLNHVLPFSMAVLCAKWTADAIEPRSIYDLLTDMNGYPFLDNKLQTLSDAVLGDIVRPARRSRLIDVSNSPWVAATELRAKLENLLMAGELDSGLPILRRGVLVGLIPAPDLEYALDNVQDEGNSLCLMCIEHGMSSAVSDDDDEGDDGTADRVDFTRFIDPVCHPPTSAFCKRFFTDMDGGQAPISLDINSPIDLVYQCFAKLGLRYLCVLRDGRYAGLVHKKAFVKFLKEDE